MGRKKKKKPKLQMSFQMKINSHHCQCAIMPRMFRFNRFSSNNIQVAQKAIINSQEIILASNEAEYIAGVSALMFSITLIGLAIGFNFLRVESILDDGKIKF